MTRLSKPLDPRARLSANIAVLFDLRYDDANERTEAAANLSEFDDPEAEAALISCSSSPAIDRVLADACGESLAWIWIRKGRLSLSALTLLSDATREEVIRMVAHWDFDLAAGDFKVRDRSTKELFCSVLTAVIANPDRKSIEDYLRKSADIASVISRGNTTLFGGMQFQFRGECLTEIRLVVTQGPAGADSTR